MAFEEVGVELGFRGEGVDEEGYVISSNGEYGIENGKVLVKIDPRYFRPTEVDLLIGDPTKAQEKLGWTPKYSLKDMIVEMVAADLETFRREKTLMDSGFSVARQFE